MKLLRTGLLAAVAGASLLLGGSGSHASGLSAATLTQGLTFGMNANGITAHLQGFTRDAQTLQARLQTLVQSQNRGYKNIWVQAYTLEQCAGGGRTCINDAQQTLVGPLTLVQVVQEGLTNGSGGPAFASIGQCLRFAPDSANPGVIDAQGAYNVGGPLVSNVDPGATSTGSVTVVNGGPTSVAALATDAASTATGFSPVQGGAAVLDASTTVSGADVSNNVFRKPAGGQLTTTFTGPVESLTFTSSLGKPLSDTVQNGTLTCGLSASAHDLASATFNALIPVP
jgi:hypothetical protein